MEYRILQSDSSPDLGMQVQDFIRDGWRPLGGVAVSRSFEASHDPRHGTTECYVVHTFAQAMVREEAK